MRLPPPTPYTPSSMTLSQFAGRNWTKVHDASKTTCIACRAMIVCAWFAQRVDGQSTMKEVFTRSRNTGTQMYVSRSSKIRKVGRTFDVELWEGPTLGTAFPSLSSRPPLYIFYVRPSPYNVTHLLGSRFEWSFFATGTIWWYIMSVCCLQGKHHFFVISSPLLHLPLIVVIFLAFFVVLFIPNYSSLIRLRIPELSLYCIGH